MAGQSAMQRCPWCEGFDLYREYHDREWGVPQFDDRALFELLILEGAQAGLSWATILKKREHYRQVFEIGTLRCLCSRRLLRQK